MPKIAPHLWYTDKAEEAARFYVSIFPNSRVDRVVASPAETPSGPAGSVTIVDFTLDGQPFHAISAGPLEPFNHAISLFIECKDQKEIDHYWHSLLEGGQPEQCGWLKDRYGVYWQVAPKALGDMIADKDRTRAKRVMEAMLKMQKIELAPLERAYKG